MKTLTYTFLIGTTDDFESLNALMDYVEANHDKGFQNYSLFEFEAPVGLDQETVTMIGRGIAFSNDWCMDDTFSCVIEGTLDGPAEQDMFEAGATAREKSKEQNRSEQQKVDPFSNGEYHPNDPRNW